MTNKIIYILGLIFLLNDNNIKAADIYSITTLPKISDVNLLSEDIASYPEGILNKSNEAFDIFNSGEALTSEKIRNGIALRFETAKLGNPYSWEQLANFCLYGKYTDYGIPQNINWGTEILIHLTIHHLTGACNSLNAINPEIYQLIKEGKIPEAKEVFIKSWAEYNQ